jgi:hypothetical protein
LNDKVAALDKATREKPATDPNITAIALVLLQIRDAVETGHPFDAEYQALVVLAREHPEIAAAAAPLDGPAASGVASRAALTERLRQLAPQIATAKPPPKATWKSQIVARLRSLVTVRRIEGADQTPAEGAVGAAQRAVASGDLAGAIVAAESLPEAPRAAAADWAKAARARLEAMKAADTLAERSIAELGAAKK